MKQQLSESIDDFLRFRRSQDYSKGTINGDKSVLLRFMAHVGNLGVWQISDRHISRYFEEASKTRQPQTLRNDWSTLAKFFEWARHTRRMAVDCDPLYGRRRPAAAKKERNRIHVSQFDHLLDVAGERDPRDRALVAVLLYTLLRDQEMADLRIGDVDLDAGYLRARITKTNQEDRIPICEELDSELRRWLSVYSSKHNLGPMDCLIPARKAMPIKGADAKFTGHVQGLYRPDAKVVHGGRIVVPILERIGFPVRDGNGKLCGEGSHTIRRSGARALFDQLVVDGYDGALRIVQAMLHHASVTMTETYLGITADRRTRDETIRGRRMYRHGGEVVALREAR